MSKKTEKVLTAKIAQKAVANRDSDLSEYTKIEESAAEVLANYEGYVQLDGISQLPEPLAKILANHKGGLSLSGIESLTEETAAVLGKIPGGLALDGLEEVSKKSAEQLISCRGGLSLDGLNKISDELLGVLADHEGGLSLGGLAQLSLEAAKLLQKHKGVLSLDGLKTLSPEVARTLAKHQDHLSLHSLENLSDDLLDIFSEREDGGYIASFFDITEIAAAKYSDDREFIVSLSFEYCDVNYKGYRIMTKREIRDLVAALNTDVKIGTPNMPGEWFEEFDISLLKDSFAIHSPWPSYIQAMRKVFFGEESVGETSLFDSVLEHAPSSDD
jgi:hypothetical protein